MRSGNSDLFDAAGAEAHKLKSVEEMYTLRRGFEAARPEIMNLTRSFSGAVLLETALDGVAEYLLHRAPKLEKSALVAIEKINPHFGNRPLDSPAFTGQMSALRRRALRRTATE